MNTKSISITVFTGEDHIGCKDEGCYVLPIKLWWKDGYLCGEVTGEKYCLLCSDKEEAETEELLEFLIGSDLLKDAISETLAEELVKFETRINKVSEKLTDRLEKTALKVAKKQIIRTGTPK